MQGAGPIHLGRKITKFVRHIRYPESRVHEINAGDVLLKVEDYKELAKGYSYSKIYTMSYLYMIKQSALKHHTDKSIVRIFLCLIRYADDVLLNLLPFSERIAGKQFFTLRSNHLNL